MHTYACFKVFVCHWSLAYCSDRIALFLLNNMTSMLDIDSCRTEKKTFCGFYYATLTTATIIDTTLYSGGERTRISAVCGLNVSAATTIHKYPQKFICQGTHIPTHTYTA